MSVSPISKAIAGFLAPGAAVLIEAILDDRGGDWPTQSEWLLAALVAIVGFAGVYAAPKNKPRA